MEKLWFLSFLILCGRNLDPLKTNNSVQTPHVPEQACGAEIKKLAVSLATMA